MKKALRAVAEEISHSLTRQATTVPVEQKSPAESVAELLVRQVAAEVLSQLEGESGPLASARELEERLQKVEAQLDGSATTDTTDSDEGDPDDDDDEDDEDDEDEVKGTSSSLPNLKYAKPKYKDVESILNYVERGEDDSGGVKVVIMNFND